MRRWWIRRRWAPPTPNALLLTALLLTVLLLAGCQQQAVDDSIARSTAPLLVPMGEWRDAFEFTAPPGSTDLYELRWNFSPGATNVVSGWQIASTTTYDQAKLAEGPGQDIIDEALRAGRGEDCVIADPTTGIQMCNYPAEFARGGVNAYLVRLLENQIIVVDYNNIGGDILKYDPDSLEARFVMADFEPFPIDGNIDDYLVYIN